jgi:hypothetical protein
LDNAAVSARGVISPWYATPDGRPIGGAVMHPLLADLDDETLRVQLRQLARRFLGLA